MQPVATISSKRHSRFNVAIASDENLVLNDGVSV